MTQSCAGCAVLNRKWTPTASGVKASAGIPVELRSIDVLPILMSVIKKLAAPAAPTTSFSGRKACCGRLVIVAVALAATVASKPNAEPRSSVGVRCEQDGFPAERRNHRKQGLQLQVPFHRLLDRLRSCLRGAVRSPRAAIVVFAEMRTDSHCMD